MTTDSRYLITTDRWFIAPDGKQYMAAWGTVTLVNDEAIGIKTNRNSTNWYAIVGNDEARHVVIAGCQIHYAVACHDRPNDSPSETWTTHEGKVVVDESPCRIYFAE